jgi:cyanophycin synthetase
VLNADDPLVNAMREKTTADVVFFSTAEEGENELLEDHIARGGIAVRMEGGQFVVRRGRLRIPIATEREVPLLLGGAARFQRQNVLAAIASAYVQGMRYDDIRAGLLSFFPSPSLTPGRLNIIRLRNGGRVLVDYAHNAAAVEGLMELVSHFPARQRIGVLGAPGDRRDDDIRALGRTAAATGRLDRAIVKEDEDLRGRDPGEVARLIADGLREAGMPDEKIVIIPTEADAVDTAIDQIGEDDLVFVLADKVPKLLSLVRERTAEIRGTA